MGQELLRRRVQSDFFPSHYEFSLDHLPGRGETAAIFAEIEKKRKRGF